MQQQVKLFQASSNEKETTKTVEKEKIVAETINGRVAMLGIIAGLGAYLTTGQIIPGFCIDARVVRNKRNITTFSIPMGFLSHRNSSLF